MKLLDKIEKSKAWAIYIRAPKWIQITLYIAFIAVGFFIGIGLGVLTTTVKSYGTNLYTHYQMTEYGVIDVTNKTPKLPDWMTDSFEADGFEIVIRPDNDFLQDHEYTEACFSASEKLIVMRKDYDGFVPYHEMGITTTGKMIVCLALLRFKLYTKPKRMITALPDNITHRRVLRNFLHHALQCITYTQMI